MSTNNAYNHSDQHNGLLVHIPKSAGIAMEPFFPHYYGHIPALETRAILTKNPDGPQWGDYYSFGFTRHPADRLASAYHYLRTMNPTHRFYCRQNAKRQAYLQTLTFTDFCADLEKHTKGDLHFLPQHHWLCDHRGRILVNHVGRYESLARDWAFVCERSGITHQPLEHANCTTGETPCENYLTDLHTEETLEATAEFYHWDYVFFGYDDKPTTPNQ